MKNRFKKILLSDTINHWLVWMIYFFISWSFYSEYLPLNKIDVSPLRLFLFNCCYIGCFIPIPYIVIRWKKHLFHQQRYLLFFFLVALLFVASSSFFALLDHLFLLQNQPKWFFTMGHLLSRLPYLIILSLIINWIQLRADYHIQRKQQAELEKLKNEAELSMLIAQISPHFLFNALNNLNSLIYTNPKQASGAVVTLSDLLRYVIYEGSKDAVPIHAEVEYLQNFIALNVMKKRLENKIAFSVNIRSEVFIQPLIFINFLENAIKHGSLEQDSDFISLSLYADDQQLVFQCKNTYRFGLSSDTTSGVGIRNVKNRLHVLYPNKHQLNIQAENGHYDVHLTLNL